MRKTERLSNMSQIKALTNLWGDSRLQRSVLCNLPTIVSSMLTLTCSAMVSASHASDERAPVSPKSETRILSDQEAWTLLPELKSGDKGVLPNWAKVVAVQMPRTAAAMLQLDAAHRLHSPLEPALRAKLRWTVANANRCNYSKATALYDLRLANDSETSIEDVSKLAGAERDAIELVRLLTLAAPTIPDELFARLREHYGDRGVAAMVLLAAYGNFQDRILLGLNIPIEASGPLAALKIEFVDGALQLAPLLPPDNGAAVYIDADKPFVPRDNDWMSVSYDQLQARLEKQRDRQPRLPIPSWEEVKAKLPREMAASPTAIRWSLINYGYAHELAIPWTIATRTHWAECPAERILEESLFWVQTRAIDCNYCMGHCEMLFQVAGMDKLATAKRTRMLAESDWSSFPPAEQRAYAFAKKLSREPWEMTAADYRSLESDFGPKKAMGIFWWLCRGLYMTRISDGFQLPLERENVFDNHAPAEVKK